MRPVVDTSPVFDAYVIVDWSAANRPRLGEDSVWYAVVERDGDALHAHPPVNPRTRHEARAAITALLLDLVARDRRVLVGCDFPYALPAGTAAALGPGRVPAWRKLWDFLVTQIEDAPNNQNNRFIVAAEINRRIGGSAFPYWNCPPTAVGPFLSSKRPLDCWDAEAPAEYRLADRQHKQAQSPWKLFTSGSVGSQTLVGIPAVAGWRDDPKLAACSLVWPFETGLVALERPGSSGWRVLHAEVYPSLLDIVPVAGQINDEKQVRQLARRFAEMDLAGMLGPRFAGPGTLTSEELRRVEEEEGWILDPAVNPQAPATESINIHVDGPPPAKDGAKSIFSPAHAHHPRVSMLRAAVVEAMNGRLPFEGVSVRLDVTYHRASGRADGLNIVNGIADVIQRRPTALSYANEAWAIDDDANIREIRYQERTASSDTYEVVITKIAP